MQIGIPDDEPIPGIPETLPGWEVPIASNYCAPGAAIEYEYDFGDSWIHRVTLERESTADPDLTYPRCLAGARACPPEDCGGPPGYEELLRVLRNPTLDEYQDMLDWLGRPFDSEAFDPTTVRFDDPRKRRRAVIGRQGRQGKSQGR